MRLIGHKSDPNAFLFSLVNKYNRPLKMKVKPNSIAICCNPMYDLIFGTKYGNGNCDIWITSPCNINGSSQSDLGWSYSHPQYPRGSYEARTFLAGSFNFQVSEIEIYAKN